MERNDKLQRLHAYLISLTNELHHYILFSSVIYASTKAGVFVSAQIN